MQEQISNLNREIVDLKKKSLEPKYQIELDKLKVEKSKLKSQNLKKLLEDITNQRNNLSQALSQEKEDNSKLKKKLEETSDIYKTVIFINFRIDFHNFNFLL